MRVGDVSLACSQGVHEEDFFRRDKHKGEAGWYVDNLVIRYVLSHGYLTAIMDSTWCSTRRPTCRSVTFVPLDTVQCIPNLYSSQQMLCEEAASQKWAGPWE
jgi:hypothetical protein